MFRPQMKRRRKEMRRQTVFLGIFATTMLIVPVFAADDNAGITGVRWGRNAFGYEPLSSGPQPVTNLKRRRDGTSDGGRLVGDYNNPILKAAAAAVVKQKGELALAGKGFPNVSDQCRAYAPPFTFAMQLSFEMLQKSDGDITIIYNQDDNVRHVRMNATHPATLLPSPMGDAVGHWEDETLVIDTVGIGTNPFVAADMYGTPQSAAMHVIERYTLIDDALAKAAQDKYLKAQGVVGGGGARETRPVFDARDKGLRVELTMDDPNVFTAPLSVLVTYRRLLTPWQEQVCAENPVEHYESEWIGLPRADHPDF
jgi:hypothetical protein